MSPAHNAVRPQTIRIPLEEVDAGFPSLKESRSAVAVALFVPMTGDDMAGDRSEDPARNHLAVDFREP